MTKICSCPVVLYREKLIKPTDQSQRAKYFCNGERNVKKGKRRNESLSCTRLTLLGEFLVVELFLGSSNQDRSFS